MTGGGSRLLSLMTLTQEEINKLGDECGFGVSNDCGGDNGVDYAKGMFWFDGDPTNLVRAVEKLILEKLDAAKNL